MKYRTKLFFAFFSLVFVTTLIALFISYSESARLLFNQIRSQLLSIATTSATFIDGNEVEKFNAESVTTRPYQSLLYRLRAIRDANRIDNFYVQYIYIIKPQADHGHFEFVLDAEEDPDKASSYGTMFPTEPELYQNFNTPFVNKNYTYDHWGVWLTAYAPIHNSEGDPVALLAIDISIQEVHAKLHNLLIFGLISLLVSIVISLIIAHFLARLVTNSLSALVETVECIGDGDFSVRIELDTNDEFDELADSINSMAKGLQERERLKMGFARYVSSYVLDRILKSDIPTNLEGERRKVTILFSDIRQFTMLSEKLPPEQVVSILNEYFERMIEVIFTYNGTLDKFIGDGIMAEFGAPLEDEKQEINSVKAAIDMQKEIDKLCQKWESEGKPTIRVGIGIHTGLAVVGNVGSEVRMEYTAIGDTVNVASRLEQATKEHEKKIIISHNTKEQLGDTVNCEDLGEISLPGRGDTIRAYAIVPDQM